MTLTRRAVAVPLVALIVFAQLVFLAVPGYALDPTKASPGITLGRTSKVFPKFFGPAGLAISIGILGYEGYKWAVEEGHLGNGSDVAQVVDYYTAPGSGNPVDGYDDPPPWQVYRVRPTSFYVSGRVYNGFSSTRTLPVELVASGLDVGTAGCSIPLSAMPTLSPYTSTMVGFTADCAEGLNAPERVHIRRSDGGSVWQQYTLTPHGTTSFLHPDGATTERRTRLRARTTDQYGITTDHEVFGDLYPADSTVIPSPSFVPPPGEWMTSLELDTVPFDGGGSPERIYEWESEPDLEVSYADCLPGGVAYPCDFGVQRLTETETDPEWQDCDELSGNCFNWWTHAQRALRFRCLWGPYVLPDSQCLQLARTYDTGTPWQGTTSTNPELVPETQPQLVPTITYPSTATQPGITIDPNTGEPITGTGTGTGTTPETGQPPVAQPGTADGCLATELVAFNPVTWVYAPVKCVFIWAFIPTQTATQWAQLRTEAETRPPFVATATAIPFARGAVAGWGGSCPSALAVFWNHDASIRHGVALDAEIPCDPDIEGMALVRAVQTFAVVAAGAFAMWRIYSSAVET